MAASPTMRQGGGKTVLRVAPMPGAKGRGRLQIGGLSMPCALGPAGITRFKREGDGATPAGRWRLVAGFYRADRMARPHTLLPMIATQPRDGWCDDPRHPCYNRPVRLPFRAGHETMQRVDRLYDVVFVTDHNQRPRKRGGGSAIFFHIAKDGWPPTAGCVAIQPQQMRRLLPLLRKATDLLIV